MVVGGVAVASGDSSASFDDSVDGFRGAVAGSASIAVGQECVLPLAQGSAQSGDVGDGTHW